MDQSIYWIQKEKVCLNSHVISSFADSWEEQAFAKDAAGPLGGCIWPPRSYTCSFCRREFRSAQALGGHMNVHRRDRARLKQISSTNNNQVVEPDTSLGRCMLQNNNQVVEPDTSLGRCMLQNPNEICNPNFDLDHALFSLSSQRPSTVSVLRPYTCSFGQEQQNSTPMLSRSKFEPRKKFHIPDLGNQEKGCCTQVLESISSPSKKNVHLIEVYLAGNLNPLVRKRRETPIFNDKDDANDSFIFKKRRIDDDPQTFFPKYSNLLNDNETESVIPLKHIPNSMLENLDLELRLGDRP